jgi:hypothetical protein
MKITTEKNLNEFIFWSGARALANKLTYAELDWISQQLEELYPNGMTDTQINDLFRFEEDFICEIINENIESVLKRK